MSADDYGLLNQAAEKDWDSNQADKFYAGFMNLSKDLRQRLSLHDLSCIYKGMVRGCLEPDPQQGENKAVAIVEHPADAAARIVRLGDIGELPHGTFLYAYFPPPKSKPSPLDYLIAKLEGLIPEAPRNHKNILMKNDDTDDYAKGVIDCIRILKK